MATLMMRCEKLEVGNGGEAQQRADEVIFVVVVEVAAVFKGDV